MKEYVTVIVPMFNESKNIHKCVGYLREQTEQRFQVVFIDDGSTDNTVQKLKEILLQSNPEFNYTILEQENAGAAKAREFGIRECNTPYIMILDCDDRISLNMIQTYLEKIHCENFPDIIVPDAMIQNSQNEYQNFEFYSPERELMSDESVIYSFLGWRVHGWFCAKKTLFLKSYQLYSQYNSSDNINNDEVIVRLNYFFADKIVRSSGIYFYENNESSVTKKINQDRYLMLKNSIIMSQLFGNQDNLEIHRHANMDLIDFTYGLLNYQKKHHKIIHNHAQWEQEFRKVLHFINKEQISRILPLKQKWRIFILKVVLFGRKFGIGKYGEY